MRWTADFEFDTYAHRIENCIEHQPHEEPMKTFETSGVCAQAISFSIADGRIEKVEFSGGCNGNLNGISSLIAGMNVADVIEKLKGTDCGGKGTSCPDQLAQALSQYIG